MLLLLAILLTLGEAASISVLDHSASDHTENFAVIVGASRYWHNYRHTTNALAFYRVVRKFGIPDSNIILMSADDGSCDPRNIKPGTAICTQDLQTDLFGGDVEIDFQSSSVTANAFLRVLTGSHDPDDPVSRRLALHPRANVLVYLTGHSGDFFMKFQDAEFITSYDIANAFRQMHQLGRYHRLLYIVDTCRAATHFTHIDAPNVVSIGSSPETEDSYASPIHHNDEAGITFIDGMSSEIVRAMTDRTGCFNGASIAELNLWDFFQGAFDKGKMLSSPAFSHSHVVDQSIRRNWLLRDFFQGKGVNSEGWSHI